MHHIHFYVPLPIIAKEVIGASAIISAGICMSVINVGQNRSTFAVLNFSMRDFHTRELSRLH